MTVHLFAQRCKLSNVVCIILYLYSTYSCFNPYSTYQKKAEHFAEKGRGDSTIHAAKQKSAHDLLTDAARVRTLETDVTLAKLQKDREEGRIDSRTPDEQLQRQAANAGFHAQSLEILRTGVTIAQYNELDNAISALEHPNGAGWTEKFGNLRTANGNADQRRRNTKMKQPVKQEPETIVLDSDRYFTIDMFVFSCQHVLTYYHPCTFVVRRTRSQQPSLLSPCQTITTVANLQVQLKFPNRSSLLRRSALVWIVSMIG